MTKLTHVNDEGKARMVDVGDKSVQKRTAVATGFIELKANTIELIKENKIKKGDVLTVAEIAGIQAAKKTSELIPLCHQISLSSISVKCDIENRGVRILSTAQCNGQTGIEMEALTAVSVALLTVYDMCKAVDKLMVIGEVKLIEKKKVDIE